MIFFCALHSLCWILCSGHLLRRLQGFLHSPHNYRLYIGHHDVWCTRLGQDQSRIKTLIKHFHCALCMQRTVQYDRMAAYNIIISHVQVQGCAAWNVIRPGREAYRKHKSLYAGVSDMNEKFLVRTVQSDLKGNTCWGHKYERAMSVID